MVIQTNPTNSNNIYTSTTFNRLQEIQVLIKKESGLKELCMYNKIYNNYFMLF